MIYEMKDTYILCMKLQRKVFIYKKKKSIFSSSFKNMIFGNSFIRDSRFVKFYPIK